DLRKMRFSKGSGYIWVNDTGRPVARMIMHPIIPDLDGQLLDDPVYNCARGTEQNLFQAFVDVALTGGAGYVDYLWPKPTRKGLTSRQPKLSYVKLFKPWGWIVGTGTYTDDIKRDTDRQVKSILRDLKKTFAQLRIGDSGYMYLFSGEGEMLLHPNLVGKNMSELLNPTTKNPILDDLISATNSPSKMLEYIWDKPPDHIGEFSFHKKSHLAYYEPLDWYIASTLYDDEIAAHAQEIANQIILLTLLILLVAFIFSFLLARNLTMPLQLLTSAAKKIDYDNISNTTVPITGSAETRRLGSILNIMLKSIQHTMRNREELLTEKVSLESRLLKAEKMESVGRLAAGIAHEINTPTQYVSSNIDFLNDAYGDITELLKQLSNRIASEHEHGKLGADFAASVEAYFEEADWEYLQEETLHALTQSKEGVQRITKIVNAMKNFSHPASGKLQLSDINLGIKSTVTVASNEWKYAAAMDLQLDATIPSVPCYRDELNQVFLNMILNSSQAIIEHNKKIGKEKGLITITTAGTDEYVEIRISDTGGGMPDEVVTKIFDPFFTTKDVGKGTGQGLAIAHDVIVNKHHGSIEVETEQGEGTTFIIHLPLNTE
ncbi:MAG: cache domain-containing protein, partial [Candidatus Thiodiazotropha sp. (ex Lucinoma kastoroae)]|nr:cache domain-containing protein [Candidatus Thiodiazotropha sp. (ex Lucinoma kastoroae)]